MVFRFVGFFGMALACPLSAAVTLVGSPVLSKIPTTACTSTPPPATTSFASTDTNITTWFTLAGLTNGDVITASWYRPDGSIVQAYSADLTAQVSSPLSTNWFCYSSLNPATDPPGTWTVRVFRNHQLPELFSQTFTLTGTSPPAGGDGNSFTGTCGTVAQPVPWNGTRISGSGVTFTGTWNTNFGILVITVNGTIISGTYPNGGTITGTVSGLDATGTWRDNTGSGVFRFTLSSTGAPATALCSPSAGNLIGNGSFEQPGSSSSVTPIYSNSATATFMPCWTVTSGNVDYVTSGFWQPSDGKVALDMDGFNPGAISQTFATTPGTLYTVSFDLAGNPGGGVQPKRMQVAALGTAQSQAYTFDASKTSYSNMGWARGQIFRFTANGSTSTLQFSSLTTDPNSNWGPVLDNVCVAAGSSPCPSAGTPPGGGQPGCSFDVRPTSLNDPTGGGLSGVFLISTAPSCTWTTTVPVPWVTLSPISGTGPGGVGYSLAANTGAPRNTTLTVATAPITVQQGAGSSCTYSLDSSNKALPGFQSGFGVTVTVSGSGCAPWTVSIPSSIPWVHPGSGSSFNGSNTATFVVDPNPGPLARSGTVTINTPAGTKTVTLTQDAPPCSYSLSPLSSPTIDPSGTTGSGLSTRVTVTGAVCAWSVVPSDVNSQWVHITSAVSATGSGDINFTADANNTTSPRSVVLNITGRNPSTTILYTINQAPAAQNTGPVPVISPGGVVNAASFIPANLPGGAIAQGSFFSIFGTRLGPTPSVQADSYPLGLSLGDVTVKITQGSISVNAIPVFAAQFQVNAVMPSNAPTGDVQVTVTFNGGTSAPAAAKVVVSNFGAFAVSGGRGPGIVQNVVSQTLRPLNASSAAAMPGQYVTLWGTGLGPLPNGASDTQPPAAGILPIPVKVFVGGKTADSKAQFFYNGRGPGLAGIDQFNFQVPSDVPLGCYVPVQVQVADTFYSNTVSMAISSDGSPCNDQNPLSTRSRTGGKNGSVTLIRLNLTDPSGGASTGSIDLGMAGFSQKAAGGDLGFDLYSSLPPVNSCTYYNNLEVLNGVLGLQLPSQGSPDSIDAGSSITVKGAKGAKGLPYSDASTAKSPYLGLFGGSGPVGMLAPGGAYLDPGSYAISGLGGKDVGPFSFTMNVPGGATWTNRDQISTIDRAQPLTINWSGGDPATQVGLILGFSTNPNTKVSGGFACLVPLDSGSFTVQPGNMANLPSGTNTGSSKSKLLFITVPRADQAVKFSTSAAPNLDNGFGLYAVGDLRTVTFR